MVVDPCLKHVEEDYCPFSMSKLGTELYCNMIIAAFSHLLRKLNDCILQLELERKRLQSRVSG